MKKFENVYYFFGKQELNPHKFIRDTLIAKPDTSHPSGSGTSKLLTIDDLIKDFNNFAFNFNNIDYKCTYHVHNLDTDNKVFKVSFTLYYSKNKLQAAYAFSDLIQTIKTRKKG